MAKSGLLRHGPATAVTRKAESHPWLSILNAAHNNLKNIDVHIPLGRFVCVTGVSGSGKSSLVNDILREVLTRDLNEAVNVNPGRHDKIVGTEHLDKIIDIDQSPIGRTPRSNPATYIKLFDDIRDLYTKLPESKLRGYKKGRFSFNVPSIGEGMMPLTEPQVAAPDDDSPDKTQGSPSEGADEHDESRVATRLAERSDDGPEDAFNVVADNESDGDLDPKSDIENRKSEITSAPTGGRCEFCQGNGSTRVEMDFLADVWVTCPVCEGRRFNRETLAVKFRGKSIADVLDMDVQQAMEHFANIPQIATKLQTLHDVGLDYLKLGQSSTTLSGGEAQRIKLAKELVRRSTGRTLYLLDEPTTGLHFEDVRRLLAVLHGVVDAGNTVIVIEHHLDVIKTADWIIDLGPEGGDAGGHLVAEGTPEDVAAYEASHTGKALRDVLGMRSAPQRDVHDSKRSGRSMKLEIGNRKSTTSTPSRALRAGNAPFPAPIRVIGAREHNLQNVSVDIPRNAMTICSGVSGSGKSSFAIDTVYTEGHRRYVESLSAYARQFLGQLQKPKVDHVYGLSPAIAIEQGAASKSPRSTVGTVTEIYDYMRVLWARLATPYCPRCNIPIGTQTTDEIVDKVAALPTGSRVMLCAPVERGIGESYADLFARHKSSGFARVRIDGVIHPLDQPVSVDDRRRHAVQIVVDRIVIRPDARGRLADSVEQCLSLGQGVMLAVVISTEPAHSDPIEREIRFSQRFSCEVCNTAYEELTPHHFSFNNRLGWCPACDGLGVQRGTRVDAIVLYPSRSILDGALLGFERLDEKPLLRTMTHALAAHIGFDAATLWNELKEEHRHQILFGTGDAWIYAETPKRRNAEPSKSEIGNRKSEIDNPKSEIRNPPSPSSLRFQFKGFFPAIDEAMKVSWLYRFKLENMVTEVPCQKCGGSRVRAEAAAARLGQHFQSRDRKEAGTVMTDRRLDFKAANDEAAPPLPHGRSSDKAIPKSETGNRKSEIALTITDACNLPLSAAYEFFTTLRLDARRKKIAGELLHEINARLKFLLDVGLEYLTLGRAAPTLSGGESQRIRLASQIGSGLTGVLYVLDEPTIGLHPRDNARLIGTLHRLRDLGNTLLVVEHDREVIQSADHVLDFGPGAGKHGGNLVGNAPPATLPLQGDSLTGAYLAGREAIPVPTNRRVLQSRIEDPPRRNRKGAAHSTSEHNEPLPHGRGSESTSNQSVPVCLTLVNTRHNNLKNLTVDFPLNRFICVTGVSGSGKSSLITDTLHPALAQRIHRAQVTPGPFDELRGVKHLDKVINVDQTPIGTSPKSNPATYTGLFDLIRELFARMPDSKVRGYTPNRFSFNRPGGRCEACEGLGEIRHEMHFLPDVWVTCDTCRGQRYNPETLDVRFKGKTIADVLNMSVAEAIALFENNPKIKRLLQTLADVGLDYVSLGQSAATLSGGEAQRVKLAAELARPATGRTIYILDEPTTGLHLHDVRKLLDVLHRFVDLGNTVLCIEHNLDVIKTADWIIDLGPEAGDAGGSVVAEGTPEQIVEKAESRKPKTEIRNRASSPATISHTALALAPVLAAGPFAERPHFDPKAAARLALDKASAGTLELAGSTETKMPWELNGRRWHTKERPSRNGEKVEWSGDVLDFIIDRVEKLAAGALATNWNDRATVEVKSTVRGAGGLQWFLHVATGGKWLIELGFRVPHGTFNEANLVKQLGLKSLNERGDLPVYGNESRAYLREIPGGWDSIRILVHDMPEVRSTGFQKFLATAVNAYVTQINKMTADSAAAKPWEANGRAWHMGQEAMTKNGPLLWTPALLIELLGKMNRILPRLKPDWNRKTHIGLMLDGREIGGLCTNSRHGLFVYLLTAPGRVAVAEVASIGRDARVDRGKPGKPDSVWFQLQTGDTLDMVALTSLLKIAGEQP